MAEAEIEVPDPGHKKTLKLPSRIVERTPKGLHAKLVLDTQKPLLGNLACAQENP